ncbi:extracellular solute-binding protein [Devosia geojensis]|nr:extracellular solute-binding protein [Devosia geojensis]
MAPAASAQEVSGEISFAWWGAEARNRAILEVVAAFEEAHPGVKVLPQPTEFARHWDRVTVQAAAGQVPCIPMMQTRYQVRYENLGALLPLDDLIAEGKIDVSTIPEELIEGHRNADGNLYTLPIGLWFETYQYNWTRLEPTGVGEPQNDWTYEDYIEWARQARTELDEGVYPLSQLGTSITQFQMYAQARGEDLFDGVEPGFSEETLADWFRLWATASEERLAPDMAMSAEEPTATPQTYMAQGITLSRTGGDVTASELQAVLNELDGSVVHQAKSPNGNNPLVSGSHTLAISTNCANVDAAAAFIDFWLNDEPAAVRLQSQVGLVPSASLLEAQAADPNSPPTLVDRIEMYTDFADTYGVRIDVWPDNTQHLVNEFRDIYQQVGFGQSSPEDAASQFAEEVRRSLALN